MWTQPASEAAREGPRGCSKQVPVRDPTPRAIRVTVDVAVNPNLKVLGQKRDSFIEVEAGGCGEPWANPGRTLLPISSRFPQGPARLVM